MGTYVRWWARGTVSSGERTKPSFYAKEVPPERIHGRDGVRPPADCGVTYGNRDMGVMISRPTGRIATQDRRGRGVPDRANSLPHLRPSCAWWVRRSSWRQIRADPALLDGFKIPR